jgi:hypothetical protein
LNYENAGFIFGVNNSEQMRLTSTGLGIGTSSPATKLHVAGTITSGISGTVGSFTLKNASGSSVAAFGINATTTFTTFEDYTGAYNWNYNGSQIMQLNSSGNLGLGVTPSAWGASWKSMSVNTVGALASTTGVTRLYHNAYNNDSNNIYRTTAAASMYSQDGAHQWFIAPSGTAGNAITFTQAMTLDASGNLLLGGTSSLSYRSQVFSATNGYTQALVQTSAFSSGNLSGTVYSGYYDGSNITDMASIRGGKENTTSGNYGGMLTFYTRPNGGSDTERARIDSSGTLLVGCTGGGSSGNAIVSYGSGGDIQRIWSTQASNPSYSLISMFSNATNPASPTGTLRVNITTNGGIANYQANDTNLSDRREKTNFSPSKSYLDVICAIPVQTFNYIDQNLEEDAGLTLGVVAQDVQAVAPELVMESNWGTEEDPKMRLSIYQTDLQYALMKALQELKAEFDAYKASHP